MVQFVHAAVVFSLLVRSYHCFVNNTWETFNGSNGEYIWNSTSVFIPQLSKSYGSIKVGQKMSMKFDFLFNGRSNPPTDEDNPRGGYEENFFRVGHEGAEAGCSAGTRYPSLWLSSGAGESGYFDVSVSAGLQCDFSKEVQGYGEIPIGEWMTITISIDETTVTFTLLDDSGSYNESWERPAITKQDDLGDVVPVWFMSDKPYPNGSPYNIGDARLKNIVITSSLFTYSPTSDPTNDPTYYPTSYPTTVPSHDPTTDPITDPTTNPTIDPTAEPTRDPTYGPTFEPTFNPSVNPTFDPTWNPTYIPTFNPTFDPTFNPTSDPTFNPTFEPTSIPTVDPTIVPTRNPTLGPSDNPSQGPTNAPSKNPTEVPTSSPSETPTQQPTTVPSGNPTQEPTVYPSQSPTFDPTSNPTNYPSEGHIIYETGITSWIETFVAEEEPKDLTVYWRIMAIGLGIVIVICLVLCWSRHKYRQYNAVSTVEDDTDHDTDADT